MHLGAKEEKMLEGEFGEVLRKAMGILVAVGTIQNAARLVPIRSAQLSGVSYKTMGDEGAQFVEEFSKMRVRVPTYLNPCGMDLARWKEMGVSEEFAQRQLALLASYRRMAVTMSLTCTPYYIRKPKRNEHLAWAESSAVVYANAVCGARTNREGGPSALAASLVGKTPYYGLHIAKNRRADVVVRMEGRLSNEECGLLGIHIGRTMGARIPYFRDLKCGADGLKHLGAAMAASGAVAMFHVEGMTPEWRVGLGGSMESMSVDREDLAQTRLSISADARPQLYAFGCPHLSLREIREIAERISRNPPPGKVWVCTSRHVKRKADRLGYTQTIERHGMVLADTCMVVSPLESLFSATAVNSGKAAVYLPTFCNQKVSFGAPGELWGEG